MEKSSIPLKYRNQNDILPLKPIYTECLKQKLHRKVLILKNTNNVKNLCYNVYNLSSI